VKLGVPPDNAPARTNLHFLHSTAKDRNWGGLNVALASWKWPYRKLRASFKVIDDRRRIRRFNDNRLSADWHARIFSPVYFDWD
jgi:hypothetical protein